MNCERTLEGFRRSVIVRPTLLSRRSLEWLTSSSHRDNFCRSGGYRQRRRRNLPCCRGSRVSRGVVRIRCHADLNNGLQIQVVRPDLRSRN